LQERIFALDIGTRSVVGLLMEIADGQQYQVIDCVVQEHAERSMLDGQIHDIVAVAEVIRQVKERLEEKHGPLTKVAVAAAGRSLKTKRITVEMDIRHRSALTRNDVLQLEFSAVQEAQAQLAQELKETDRTRYYCVGYSVVNYFLDGDIIGNLVDQRGDTASVDVIATFLPRVVVDSLLTALQRSGLEMQALTLEPIAAIHVLIPPTMRRLNIALVDIGAGTSDIALTEEGAITAYGMVPVAGDEITDALMNAFLLDFPVAEAVKRQLHKEETVSFVDILGVSHTLSSSDVVAAIEADVQKLAAHIAEKIFELNGKAPQAVMLIGGGSLTPLLPEKLAGILKIPAARVAVRGADAISQYVGQHPVVSGPEFVTPVGIAVAAEMHPIKYVTVTVNDQPLRIFDLRKMTVADALLAVGVDLKRLYGRPGLAMTVTVNGKLKMIPGGHGTAPVLILNGQDAQLDQELSDGDAITVIPGEDGKAACATVLDVIEEVDTLDLVYNGQPRSLGPVAIVNGTPRPLDTPLEDRDQVELRFPRTLQEVLRELDPAIPDHTPSANAQYLTFTVNGQHVRHPIKEIILTLNGKEASPNAIVRSGDEIVFETRVYAHPCIRDVVSPDEWQHQEITVTFNGRPVTIPTSQLAIKMDGRPVELDQNIHDGASITVETVPGDAPIFSDVFRFVDFESTPPEGNPKARLHILINGEPASYHSEIKGGDRLELYWD
jgi:cell division protein FtsA